MKAVTFGLCLLVPALTPVLGQDMRGAAARSLFADQKASRVGDAVTVLVLETSSASNDARTSASRESDISLGATAQTGSGSGTNLGFNLGTGSAFRGEGATASRGSVRARIAAIVDSVLANGNLVVSGNRTIVVNGEEQIIRLSGVIRPSDIQADNSVYSSNIVEASVVFEGNGVVSRAQGPGWITKLLHWLL